MSCGTLIVVTEDERPRNQISGSVDGTAFQVGSVHGDVVFRQSSTALNEGGPQAVLARQLADQVRMLSRREEENWRIADPLPLPVRWRTADEELFDHWDNVNGRSGSEPVSLAGHFAEIRETYESVPSGRLVILGRAGAGKTVFAHRLILSLIGDGDRSGPVPVLFSISGWNATSTALRTWMVHQLVRDFPFLDAADRTGKNGAETLVDGDGILPVLDGFDEIPAQHHPDAIREISRFDGPLVVTSRPDEYTGAALAAKVLSRAAAIHLEDLTLDDAERYLVASTAKTRTAEWEAVFAHLRAAPDELASRNLTPVMATPLMVMLARTTYNDTAAHDPAELLDADRFPAGEAIEEHLLSAYLDSVYDPRRGNNSGRPVRPENARHWLGYLAAHLEDRNTHDLAWWQLPSALHRHTRILIAVVGSLLVIWVVRAVQTIPSGVLAGIMNELESGLSFVIACAIAVGISVEGGFFRSRRGHEPERVRLRLWRRRSSAQPSVRSRLKSVIHESGGGLASGLLFGLAYGFLWKFGDVVACVVSAQCDYVTQAFVLLGYVETLTRAGLSIGFAIGGANLVVSALGESQSPREAVDPWQLLTADCAVTLVRSGTAVLAITSTLLAADAFPTPTAFLFGIMGGMVQLGLSAWGTWVLYVRFWLPLTRRLPMRPKHFLEDAYRRGVLRQAGAVYQFRHARLRDHLARQHQG